jgi:ABC-type uncharacterized transport system permease subunit
MSYALIVALAALICLAALAAGAVRLRHEARSAHLLLLAAAGAGVSLAVTVRIVDGWHADLSTALWATTAATVLIAFILTALRAMATSYLVLLGPYMLLLGLLAVALSAGSGAPPPMAALSLPVTVHVIDSVLTYGLATIAAIVALAATLKQRALKTKRDGGIVRRLPSVAESERLVFRLLIVAEILLFVGLMTGSILSYRQNGVILPFDHKTFLTALSFIVIGALIALHVFTGMRGRAAARFVLIAWILLTLGYPGVKFVTDILVG